MTPKKSTHSNPSPDAACLRRDASHVDGACLYLRRRSCGSRRSRWSCSLNFRRTLGTWEKLHPFPGSKKQVDQKLERVGWLIYFGTLNSKTKIHGPQLLLSYWWSFWSGSLHRGGSGNCHRGQVWPAFRRG